MPASAARTNSAVMRLVDSTTARIGVVVVAILLASGIVFSTSLAAFSGTTSNASNSVSTGSVVLADNDSGTAMFNALTGLAPGTNYDRCIRVDYSGSLNPLAVRLYMGSAPTGTLGQYLNLTVDIGPSNGDAFPNCTSFTSSSTIYTGTISGFRTSHQAWASGLSTGWDPAASGEARVFRFRIAVQDDNNAQGLTSGFGFTWETQSA